MPANAMMAGDGTLAVVGSRLLPRMVSGLAEIGRDKTFSGFLSQFPVRVTLDSPPWENLGTSWRIKVPLIRLPRYYA